MRDLNKSIIRKIYFNTPPLLLGELFLFAGTFAFIFMAPSKDSWILLVFGFIGGYFVWRKIKRLKTGLFAIKYGQKSVAELVSIQQTHETHNNRNVLKYVFEFDANGTIERTYFKSALHRYLKIGYKSTIFYAPQSPSSGIIPALYNINIE